MVATSQHLSDSPFARKKVSSENDPKQAHFYALEVIVNRLRSSLRWRSFLRFLSSLAMVGAAILLIISASAERYTTSFIPYLAILVGVGLLESVSYLVYLGQRQGFLILKTMILGEHTPPALLSFVERTGVLDALRNRGYVMDYWQSAAERSEAFFATEKWLHSPRS